MAIQPTPTHTVDSRWIPDRMHNLTWVTLDDVTALAQGDILFDPVQHAHYAGEITAITEVNGAQFALITWVKSADNIIQDCIPFTRLKNMYLWWADPCMQEM